MKDEWDGKMIVKFVGLRANTYSYLIGDGSENKKAKITKKCIIKRKFTSGNYEKYLEVSQLVNRINYLEKNNVNIDSL